ncbi:MAG: hypothetical protein ACTMHL_13950, partial [Janibacter sp.]
MLLQLSVIDAREGHQRPVEVRAEPHHTLTDLLDGLALPTDSAVHVDGTVCPPDAVVGHPPLLEGAALVLGHQGTPTRTTATDPLRLATSTGPDAGRSLGL